MKDALRYIGAALGGIALLGGAWFGWTQFQRTTADYRGETRQIEQTQANERFRIQAYDSFFDLCAAVQTDEARLDALATELDTDPSSGRVEQINASIAAIETSRASKINRYNADAAKDWTVGQFQANSLPYRINLEGETTCAP